MSIHYKVLSSVDLQFTDFSGSALKANILHFENTFKFTSSSSVVSVEKTEDILPWEVTSETPLMGNRC